MAQFLPDRIELTSAEAFAIAAALESAGQILAGTEWVSVTMEVEEAHAVLVQKLFPEDQE